MKRTALANAIRCTLLLLITILLPTAGCQRKVTEPIANSDAAAVESSPAVAVAPGDWPWWHGPQQNAAVTAESPAATAVPTVPDPEKNLRWRVILDGRGHASPIIVGNKVFLANANRTLKKMSLICFNVDDGSRAWETELHSGSFMRSHDKNSYASATPACDGERIFTAQMIDDGIQVSAVNLDGDILWQRTAGSFNSRHGYGSSPVIYKSLVIVNGDNDGSGFIAALDRESGKIVWRVKRHLNASFATPIVAHTGGRDQLLVSGHSKVISYNPTTGEELWFAKGTSPTTANTVAWNEEIVITSGGYPEQGVIAIRTDGSGEVIWEKSLKEYVPSPLLVDDRVLITNDNGILYCLNAADGKTLWKQRLAGDCSGSPICIGGMIVQGTESGRVYCYRIDPEFELISEFDLDGRILTTPAASGKGLFIRTANWLYRFAAPEETVAAATQ